jgi:hypothetical protein
MSPSQILQTTFDGLRAPHYFNGRLLGAEELKADQEAVLTRLAWLGRAVGHGVADGLMVRPATGSASSLSVTGGLGLNRAGQPVRLSSTVTLPLTLAAAEAAPLDDAGRFKACDFDATGTATAVPGGAYILVACPASRLEGVAPIKGSPCSTLPAGCTSRWEVEGLQFKAIRLDGFNPNATGVTNQNRRNLLAHWSFGSLALRDLARDPFHFSDEFGGLDSLSAADLTPCDLPLAVFHWTGTALTFADPWSARRRLTRRGGLDAWTGLLSDKRVAEGQARFLQFQDQIDELSSAANAATIVAAQHLRFLPPVGFLPIVPNALVNRLVQMTSGAAGTAATGGVGFLQMVQTFHQAINMAVAADVSVSKTIAVSQAGTAFSPGGGGAYSAYNAGVTEDPQLAQVRVVANALSEEMAAVQARLGEIDDLKQQVAALAQQVAGGAAPAGPATAPGTQAQALQLAAALAAALGASAANARGFNIATFFGQMPDRIGIIDRDSVDFTLQRSWYDEPVDLTLPAGQRPKVDLYLVEENILSGAQPYVMLAKNVRPVIWLTL